MKIGTTTTTRNISFVCGCTCFLFTSLRLPFFCYSFHFFRMFCTFFIIFSHKLQIYDCVYRPYMPHISSISIFFDCLFNAAAVSLLPFCLLYEMMSENVFINFQYTKSVRKTISFSILCCFFLLTFNMKCIQIQTNLKLDVFVFSCLFAFIGMAYFSYFAVHTF